MAPATIEYNLELPIPKENVNISVTPTVNDTMTFHRITKESNHSALLMEMSSTNSSLIFKLFIKADYKPSENDSTWQVILPDEEGSFEHALQDDAMHAGEYVVGVKQCKQLFISS